MKSSVSKISLPMNIFSDVLSLVCFMVSLNFASRATALSVLPLTISIFDRVIILRNNNYTHITRGKKFLTIVSVILIALLIFSSVLTGLCGEYKDGEDSSGNAHFEFNNGSKLFYGMNIEYKFWAITTFATMLLLFVIDNIFIYLSKKTSFDSEKKILNVFDEIIEQKFQNERKKEKIER